MTWSCSQKLIDCDSAEYVARENKKKTYSLHIIHKWVVQI